MKAPRGAPDSLPPDSEVLDEVESVARRLFDGAGYRRIDTPAFEHTDVFLRPIGESSDIVRKEMYTFKDRAGRSLTLRPEGTAPVARSFVEHRLDGKFPSPLRLWYLGPMFRYERPQLGRARQFGQAGIECFGAASPVADAEVIVLGAEFFEILGLPTRLELNTIGCADDRERYREVLRDALGSRLDSLCADCHDRLRANPLRVFDCKVPSCREVLHGAGLPMIADAVCEECKAHFESVKRLLRAAGVEWQDVGDLVRGLDYYTRTVFEFHDPEWDGPRSALCSGGRYDGLVEQLGGASTPGVGFAIGLVPVLVSLARFRSAPSWRPDVYLAWIEGVDAEALVLARELRRAGLRVVMADESQSLKSQLRAASRYDAPTALILGPKEVERGVAQVRDLGSGTQEEVAVSEVASRLTEKVG